MDIRSSLLVDLSAGHLGDHDQLVSDVENIVSHSQDRDVTLQTVAEVLRRSGNYHWVDLYDVDHSAGLVRNILWSGPAAPAVQFSPDGRWVAFQSNESGRFEVYVQPFPRPGGKFQISTNGGAQVRWRRDGKEICSRINRQNPVLSALALNPQRPHRNERVHSTP